MAQSLRSAGNVFSIFQQAEPDPAASALELVYQAADVFNAMQAQARETEERAQSMCDTAAQRLRIALSRMEAAENARFEIIDETEAKILDATQAVERAEQQIMAAEDRAMAAERRAELAEKKARELEQSLALIEETIRARFSTDIATAGPQRLRAVA